MESELSGFSHWDRARHAVEDGPCSMAGGVQGTQGGLLTGTGPRRHLAPGLQPLLTAEGSPISGVSHRALRAVEASEKAGGERIATDRRIGCSGCVADMMGVVRRAQRGAGE